MSNILYIGPYREFTSDGNIARNYIESLVHSGHNISIRPIYNTFRPYPESEIDKEILALEKNSSKKYSAVIQHCYPHQYCLDSRFDTTIGILSVESFNYKDRLTDFLKVPNRIIVPSNYVKSCSIDIYNNPDIRIDIIPPSINLTKIKEHKKTYPITKNTDKPFTFYVIEDFVHKNNLNTILEAYWSVVNNEEAIDIVIKTKSKNKENLDLYQIIEYEFGKLGSMISKFNRKPKVVLGDIKQEAIYYFHNNNSCYIDVSSGKSFGYSVLEAMAFDSSIITMSKSAQSEIIADTNNYSIDTHIEYCKDENKTYNTYNTINQRWFTPNLQNLMVNMFNAIHEEPQHKIDRLNQAKQKIIENYSVEAVSAKFKNYDI